MPPGNTLADLLDLLAINIDPDALLLVVNGRLAEVELSLKDGDVVHLIPALSGG